MEGTNLTRAMRLGLHLVMHPRDAWRWTGDRLRSQKPLERRLPWISWPAIDRLRQEIKPGMSVFEWGAGGSTVFFGDRGASVTTVESEDAWIAAVETAMAGSGDGSRRHEIRRVPADAPGDAYSHAVEEGGPWDLILVDGVNEGRMTCLSLATRCLKPGGLIVLDDSWRQEYAEAPQILVGFERTIFRGPGPCRPGVTQTDFYRDVRTSAD